ncbi:enoyl-CoA hydratase/isomerase family protein [bacterium]|nr:enoyl-CoA hydratase/isomerase family protein [bacterium]
MSDPAVRVEVRPDGVAVLTIDQPGAKVNVLTVALWAELEATIDVLAARTDVAGLVIASGKPGCFIAGADLHLLANATPGGPAVKAFIEQGLRVLGKLEALPFPTCAAIDGVALGGGLEVALACDIRVAGSNPKVQLGLPEVKLGLIPGWGGTQRLRRITTLRTALRLLLEGMTLSGHEAVEVILVDTDAPSEELIDAAADYLPGYQPQDRVDLRAWRQAATNVEIPSGIVVPDTTAAREAYRVTTEGHRLPLAEGIALETEAFLRLAGADESRAKIAAFFAARKR